MSRTDLDAHTLARSLRRMAGDGSVEWVMEPIQADVLRDVADALAENAELRELADAVKEFVEDTHCEDCPCRRDCNDNNSIFCANDFSYHAFATMRELGVEVE